MFKLKKIEHGLAECTVRSLTRIGNSKQICLAHPLSSECFTALKGTDNIYIFIWDNGSSSETHF